MSDKSAKIFQILRINDFITPKLWGRSEMSPPGSWRTHDVRSEMNFKVAVHATLARITVRENEAQILQIDQYETFTVSLKFIHLLSFFGN